MPEKQKILKYILIFLTLLFSFLVWFSVSQAINVPTASNWGIPILWFSFFFISLSLCLVLIKRLVFAELIILATFFLSLLFVFIWEGIFQHILVILISFLFASWGIRRIRQDLKLNIIIDLWKTLRTGSALLIFAFSLIIASQYYWETKNTSLENTLPKFKIDAFSEKLTSKVLSFVNPDFKNLDEENITVDQFILETRKKQFTESLVSEELSNELFENSQALVLEEGRRQLSDLAGIKLNGQEKLSDIFSSTVNNRINNLISPSFSDNSQLPLLHLILAFILFLTVASLGSFLGILLIPLANLIFFGFRKSGWVEIIKIQKEVEEIA